MSTVAVAFDACEVGEVCAKRRGDRRHFALALRRTGNRQDRAVRHDDRRVLDEGAVGVRGIGRQHRDVEAAVAQRVAVGGVLREREVDVGAAEVDAGQAVGEAGTGQAGDRAGERHRGRLSARP